MVFSISSSDIFANFDESPVFVSALALCVASSSSVSSSPLSSPFSFNRSSNSPLTLAALLAISPSDAATLLPPTSTFAMPPSAALSLVTSLVCSGPLTSPANVSRIAPSLLTSESLMPPSASLVCLMPSASPLKPLPPVSPLTAFITLARFFPAPFRLSRFPTLESAVNPAARWFSFRPASPSIPLATAAIRAIPWTTLLKLEAPETAPLS